MKNTGLQFGQRKVSVVSPGLEGIVFSLGKVLLIYMDLEILGLTTGREAWCLENNNWTGYQNYQNIPMLTLNSL